ncbi:MAG: hypothetical protein RLO81_14120, partial [Fulvivirga sp.]|uniref:hypothetical protein n=1 Tax=Fulvivirga sp. TaxID=1931237 RepID=UPI0032ED7E57
GSDTGNPIPSDSINQISPDSLILVQERLITELIIYFDDEIDYWLLTHGKGPLEIQEIRRLLELPGCLPEDGGQLEIIQTALNSLLEDISGFLSSLFETDGNQDILDEICQDLDTTRESLLTQLSDEDLETCEEMLCEYLNEDEYDFTLELLQSEDIQESGSTLLISAEPQMPDIRARVALENNNDVEVEMRLIIEYSRTCPDAPSRSRNDITYFPSTGWHRANTNDTWDIDFGHDNSVGIQRPMIRGGRASLIFRFGEMQGDTVEFMIKGENPTVEEVMDALDEAPYSNIWFMKKMALHESGTRNPTNNNSRAQQFNYQNDCCESLDEDWDAWSRCPTRGAPCGWGLMQMDLPAPTVQSMWDWRANIHQAYNLLNGEKRQSVINHMRRSMNTINSWNQRNSDDQVQEHDDQEEGGMTYTHSLSNQFQNTGITNFDDHFGDEPDGDDKSFLDACWIKTYNGLGTARLHFYYITQEGANRPEWNISNTATYGNSVNYYVEDISEQDTPD